MEGTRSQPAPPPPAEHRPLGTLDLERWHGRIREAMARLPVHGRESPRTYVKLIDALVHKQLEARDDKALGESEVTGLGVQDRNLSRVAKKLQRYLTDAATLSNVPDRARVHFKDQQIWLELRSVAKALVLLELHPGRFAGDRFTEPLIETLSDVCDETTFRVVHGGHLLSGQHQVYLVLEGEDYSQMCYEFITRVIETANTRLLAREKLPAARSEAPLAQSCYRYNIIPILPQGEFDMDLIRAWKDRGSRKAS